MQVPMPSGVSAATAQRPTPAARPNASQGMAPLSPFGGTSDLFAGIPSAPPPTPKNLDRDNSSAAVPSGPNLFSALTDKDWEKASSKVASATSNETHTPKNSDAKALSAYQASSATYARVTDERIDHSANLPVPLVIVAILDFFWATGLGLLAILLVAAGGFLAKYLPTGGIGLVLLGIYMLLDAGAYVVTGAMLFTRKTWGWYVAIGTHMLGLCSGLADAISYMILNGVDTGKFFGLGISGYAIGVLSILANDSTRARFGVKTSPTKVLGIFAGIMLTVGFAVNFPINYFAKQSVDMITTEDGGASTSIDDLEPD